MAQRGRPSKYKAEFVEQVYKLALLGLTDKELSVFFEISEGKFNGWKRKYPEFRQSLRKGRDIADAEVTKRLYERAMGYEHDDEEIKVVALGDNMGSIVERVKVRRYYPPETHALKFWLINRQRGRWTEKSELGFTNKAGEDIAINFIPAPGCEPLPDKTDKTDKTDKADQNSGE